MKKLSKFFENESGQALVFIALLLAVLCGIAALVIDAGMLYGKKVEIQTAADAAALAGAQELPGNVDEARKSAISLAEQNGVPISGIKIQTPYKGDSTKIEVECKITEPNLFAKVLGFMSTDISARAVAENDPAWNGEGLPFINWEKSFLTMKTQVDVWQKVDSGYFECIENFDIMNNVSPYDKIYFQLHIEDGLQIKNGKVANKKQEIGYYYNTHKSTLIPTPYVYIFSLSPKAFATGKAILQNGTEKNITDLKNKADYVSLKSLVLVKCTFDDYEKKILKLTSVAAYDLGNDDAGYPNLPDYPLDYEGPNSNGSKLVE